MKVFTRVVLCGLMGLLFPLRIASAQDHQVTPWRHNYAGAVTLTFDDGLPSQVGDAVPALNARGLKASFFIIPSEVPSNPTGGDVTWDQWRQVAAQGHEIGSQTFSDPDLRTLSDSQLRFELSESQRVINQNIPSQAAISLIYPFGESNPNVRAVASEYYVSARGAYGDLGGGHLNFYEDPDPSWPVPPTISLGNYKAVDFFNVAADNLRDSPLSEVYDRIDFAIARHAWYVVYVHDIEAPFGRAELEALLDRILASDIWMATYGEVAQYMRERKASTLSVLSSDSSMIRLSLTNTVNGLPNSVPLTLRSVVPNGWQSVSITQGSFFAIIGSTVEGTSRVVYFDALPNGGTIVLTQSGPDFSLGATPGGQTLLRGASGNYGVTLNPINGFTGAVTLSVSGLPTGTTGTFTPNPASGSSTLTVTTTASTPAGTYPLTITGVSGTLSHSTTVSLTVNGPDYSLSATPGSRAFLAGGSGTYSVTISPTGGFTGAVTLSVSGLPTGTTGTFTPNPATGSSTLTVTTTASTPAGTYPLTITGVSGALSHSTTVSLTVNVPDFSLSANPASQAIVPGGSGTYSVTINPTNGFTGAVTLSVSGLPTGTTGTFTPNPASGSSTLTVTTTASAPLGTYPLTITAVNGTLSHVATVSLSVTATVVAFDAVGPSGAGASVTSGSSLSWNHSVTSSGSNRLLMVAVAVGAGPDTNRTLAVTYNGVAMTSVGLVHSNNQAAGYVQLFALKAPASGTLPVRVTLSGGNASLEAGSVSFTGVDQTTPLRNVVTSFGTGASPNVTVTSAPGNMVVDAMVTGCNGTITSSKTLRWLRQVNCLTAGGVGGQSTAAGAASVTMGYTVPTDWWGMIGADIVAAPGQPAIDFTLSNEGDKSVTRGSAVTNAVTATLLSGTAQNATFGVSGLPAGVTASFNPGGCSPTCSTTLTISANASAAIGAWPVTLTGTAGLVSRTTIFTLNVTAVPDFSLSANPASQTIVPGGSATYSVTISPTSGFTGAVTLSVSGLPTGTTGAFTPNPTSGSSTLTVTTTASTPAGTYPLTITGVSGALSHSTTVSLIVNVPDFSLGAMPPTQTVAPGGSGTYGVTISPTGGFTGAVTLSVSGLPTGTTGTFTPNPASGSSTLTVTTTASTPAGTYPLTITGVSGALSHSTTVSLTVNVPDFSLSVTPPTQTVAPGGSGTYSVTISPTNGFTGAVTLSVSGLPTGTTGTFTPNPATGSSTLTVTTTASAPLGTYPLTITAVNGTLSHVATVSLSVTATVVAFDAVGPSGAGASVTSGSSLSWNHSVTSSGSNRLLMVAVAVGAGPPDTNRTLAVTYNGVAMTSVGLVHSNNQAAGYVQLFALKAPASGTLPVQVTLSGGNASLEAGSVSFTGVDQTTPLRNVVTRFGTGVSPNVTVTSAPRNMVVDAMVTGCNGTITSSKTLRWLRQVNCLTAGGVGGQSTAAGAASVTMGYTVPTDWWGMIGADIVAAP